MLRTHLNSSSRRISFAWHKIVYPQDIQIRVIPFLSFIFLSCPIKSTIGSTPPHRGCELQDPKRQKHRVKSEQYMHVCMLGNKGFSDAIAGLRNRTSGAVFRNIASNGICVSGVVRVTWLDQSSLMPDSFSNELLWFTRELRLLMWTLLQCIEIVRMKFADNAQSMLTEV